MTIQFSKQPTELTAPKWGQASFAEEPVRARDDPGKERIKWLIPTSTTLNYGRASA